MLSNHENYSHKLDEASEQSQTRFNGKEQPEVLSSDSIVPTVSLVDAVRTLTPETGKAPRNQVLVRILLEEEDMAERERLFRIAEKRTGISFRHLWQSAATELDRRKCQPQAPEVENAEVTRDVKIEQEDSLSSILNHAQNTVTLGAQSVVATELVYVGAFDSGSIVLSSDGSVRPVGQLPDGYRITNAPPDRSPISPMGIRRFCAGETTSGLELIKTIRDIFRSHVMFKDPSLPTVLALWTIATYCYSLFQHFGYVWLTSLRPESGKSLVAKIVSRLTNICKLLQVPKR